MRINEIPQPRKKLSALQSIKFYCKNVCCCGDLKSWRYCTAVKCTLYKYRLGIGNKSQNKKSNEKQHSTPLNSEKQEVLK